MGFRPISHDKGYILHTTLKPFSRDRLNFMKSDKLSVIYIYGFLPRVYKTVREFVGDGTCKV